MKKQFLVLTIGMSLLAFGACAQGHDHSKMNMKDGDAMTMESYDTPKAFQAQLQTVFTATLDLNNAFVTSDMKKVKTSAAKVKTAVSNVDMKLVKGAAHMAWMDNLKSFNANLDNILNASDIAAQRTSFASYNTALYMSMKSFGTNGQMAYYLYCPMANDNKGAYWMNTSGEINNPYLDSAMLKCGSTKEMLN